MEVTVASAFYVPTITIVPVHAVVVEIAWGRPAPALDHSETFAADPDMARNRVERMVVVRET